MADEADQKAAPETAVATQPPPVDPAVEYAPSSEEGDGVAAEAADPAGPPYPPIDHEFWDEMKAWARREIHLSQTGGDEEHRKMVNP